MTRIQPAKRAAQLDERLRRQLEDWGNHAEPRRPRLGHTADCPNNGRPMRRCRFCRAEQLGRRDQTPPAAGAPERSDLEAAPLAELRACTHCHRPTDHPSVLCDRCQPRDEAL